MRNNAIMMLMQNLEEACEIPFSSFIMTKMFKVHLVIGD